MADDPNQHIEEYLKQYISFPHAPGFAVLLEGPWGSGKTYLIKKFIRENFDETTRCAYISLYGIRTLDELESAVFQAIYPILNKKTTKLVGKAAKSILKFKHFWDEFKISDVLDKFGADVFVFDDLERSEMPLNQSMGYINEYVEHDGCKVIILANQKKIQHKEEYLERKEKIIGKSLRVRPDLENALDHFIAKIDDKAAREFILKHRKGIASLYNQSKIGNLRILQQTLWDFERLLKNLTVEQRKSNGALKLLHLFLALSFEIKSGNIKINDINPRPNKIILSMKSITTKEEKENDPLLSANEKYPQIDLFDQTISDELLVDFLQNGIFEQEKIQSHLHSTPLFSEPEDEPAWSTIWHMLSRPEADVNRALYELERDFNERKFTTTGIILHIFGLRLLLAKERLTKGGPRKVLAECKKYVDDIYKSKTIEPAPLSSHPREFHYHHIGYNGLGIYENETKEFQELFKYLNEARSRALKDSFAIRANVLLEEMKSDPDMFFRRVNHTSSDENLYYSVPILKVIEPDKFAKNLLSLTPNAQRIIFTALSARYEHGQLARELPDEKDWLMRVRKSIKRQIHSGSKLTKYRMAQFDDLYIAPLLDEPNSASDQQSNSSSPSMTE